jgi:hypothetical protein
MKLRGLLLLDAGLALLAAIPVAAQTGPANGSTLLRSDGAVYLVVNGVRHQMSSAPMSDDQINGLAEDEPYDSGVVPLGPAFGIAARSDGAIYLLLGSTRHLLPPGAMPDDAINALPEGVPYVGGIPALVAAALPVGGGPAAVAPVGAGSKVHVDLTEWSLTPSTTTLAAGDTVFEVSVPPASKFRS